MINTECEPTLSVWAGAPSVQRATLLGSASAKCGPRVITKAMKTTGVATADDHDKLMNHLTQQTTDDLYTTPVLFDEPQHRLALMNELPQYVCEDALGTRIGTESHGYHMLTRMGHEPYAPGNSYTLKQPVELEQCTAEYTKNKQ